MRDDLLAWQWATYAGFHRSRANLILHGVAVPLFLLGTVALLAAPFLDARLALGGVAMALSLALQGRGHRGEPSAPIPFDGPLDALSRLFVEQWVSFPRFVLSGGFSAAWRRAR
ncbi:MAG: terminase [Myxococcota bacterium]